jgi:hypothetical protein
VKNEKSGSWKLMFEQGPEACKTFKIYQRKT